MNKLEQMNFASLKDTEVKSLMDFEKQLNDAHSGEEVYVMVLKK